MRGKVIGIVSPKGGVGKTTIASSLGAFLAREHDQSAILADMNFHTPNVFHYLGLNRHPELTPNLRKLIERNSMHVEACCSHSSGLHVVPSFADLSGETTFDVDELRKNLDSLRKTYDYILLDSPPGFNKTVKQVLGVSDDVIIVTTPDSPSVLSTAGAIDLANSLNSKHHVVVNKTTGHKHEMHSSEIEDLLGSKVISEIPFEFNVMTSAFRGVPAVEQSRNFKKNIGQISEKITGLSYAEESRLRRLLGFFSH